MPELPDLAIVSDAFHAALAGRPIVAIDAPAPLVIRATPAELGALVGRELLRVGRRGKFLVFTLSVGRIIANPMLTGRFGIGLPATRAGARPAVTITLGTRTAVPVDADAWTDGAAWLPPDGGAVELRYFDGPQMGKIYVEVGPAPRVVPGMEPGSQGPDADDPALSAEEWRARIRRHPGELKSLLRNQAFVAGIGNAYSDEILHRAALLPFRKRSTLAPEEVDALYASMRGTIEDAKVVLRERVPPSFERQVRDFLAVHRRGGEPCPRCGVRLSEVQAGGMATTFCRGCQR